MDIIVTYGTSSIIFILVTTDVVGDNWCGHFGLWPFRFVAVPVYDRSGLWPFLSVAVSVCGRFGLWPFRFVAIPVCGRSGLWPFRFVAVSVYGRFGLWPFRFVAVSVCGRFGLWPFRFVAVSVCGCFGCGRFGLWPLWPVTTEMTPFASLSHNQSWTGIRMCIWMDRVNSSCKETAIHEIIWLIPKQW